MLERDVWAEVDLSALEHNYREIKKCIKGGVQLCAVVKANAYGHGAVPASRVALEAGASYLAVATLPEALELRQAGFTCPILILGLVPCEAAGEIVAQNITQAVCTKALAEALSQAAVKQGKTVKVHLKLDTGMGRIGIPAEDAASFAKFLANLPGITLEGIFSHFAAADTRDKSAARKQLELFLSADKAVKSVGINIPLRHIAESAAILEMPEAHLDMVRAGIVQYGLWPSEEVGRPIALRQVMRLCGRVAFIKDVEPGASVGYGGEFVARRRSRIATLPLGYADGYIRAYKGGFVEIRGRLAPIAGRVCMDQVMVDVTDIEGVNMGEKVTLFGSDILTIDDAAKKIGSINYEVTCLVSNRVPRIYICR